MHVSDIGLRGAPDETVLAAADADSRILITADTDFGTLLALSGTARPSVILLRRPGRRSTERAQGARTADQVVRFQIRLQWCAQAWSKTTEVARPLAWTESGADEGGSAMTSESSAALPEPPERAGKDWDERRRTAVEAWKLGRKTMKPKLRRPVPQPRTAARRAS